MVGVHKAANSHSSANCCGCSCSLSGHMIIWSRTALQIGSYGGVIMYMAIGLCLGVAFGTALDNLPLGIAIGVAVGAGIDSSRSSKRKKDKEDEEDEDL